MLLSIVFSFRNEEDVLDELIRRVTRTLAPLDIRYEMIFVNDDSTDRSMEILLSHSKKNKDVKIINMSRRFGVTPCAFAGMEYAKGDIVIYMDADLQDPPELIPQMIDKFKAGAEVVNMTRTERKGEGALKMWLTKRAYKAIDFMSDIDLPENTGDFKLLSRRVVDQLMKLNESDPYMRGLVSWIGFKQEAIFYKREARFAGETHFSLWKSINPGKEFIRGLTSFSSLPLYFALIVGFLVSSGAFAYLVYIVVSKVFLGMHLPGWPAVMVTMLFLGGTILFTIGVLGIYIGRIHDQIKERPRFIIRSMMGFDDQ